MTDPAPLLARIRRAFPRVGFDTVTALATAPELVTVELDSRWLVRIPSDAATAEALRREAALLPLIRAGVTLPLPEVQLDDWQPPMALQPRLPGVALTRALYQSFGEPQRDTLARDIARLLRDLHRLPAAPLQAVGLPELGPLAPVDAIRSRALPLLPPALLRRAAPRMRAYAALGPDPLGEAPGLFAAEEGVLAVDPASGRLEGVIRLSGAGYGARHRDIACLAAIAPDLARRTATAYEVAAAVGLDRPRLTVLTAALWLSDLAASADTPAAQSPLIRGLADWLAEAEAEPVPAAPRAAPGTAA